MIESIKTINDLVSAYQHCETYEDQLNFFTALNTQLPDMITNMSQLMNLIKMIDIKNNAIESVKKKTSQPICDLKEDVIDEKICAVDIFEYVITLFGNKLSKLTRNFEDLYRLFHHEAKHKRVTTAKLIIENIDSHLSDFIKNVSHFVRLSNVLSPKLLSLVVMRISDKFPAMVNSPQELIKMFSLLGASRQLELISKMDGKLIDMVKNSRDLADILAAAKDDENTSGASRVAASSTVKSHILKLVKNNLVNSEFVASEEDLYSILIPLPVSDQTVVMTLLKDKLDNIISQDTNDRVIRGFTMAFIKGAYEPPYKWFYGVHDPVKRDFCGDLDRVFSYCDKNATLEMRILDRFNKAYRNQLLNDKKVYPFHLLSRREHKGEFNQRAKQIAATHVIEDVMNHKKSFLHIFQFNDDIKNAVLQNISNKLENCIPPYVCETPNFRLS